MVNIGSGNDLLHDGTKPLPEPILTNHLWCLVAFGWGGDHRKCSRYQSLIIVKIRHFSGANELTFHHILYTEIAQQQEHLAQKLQSRREKRMQELIEEQEKQREELLTSSDGDTNTSKSMEVSWSLTLLMLGMEYCAFMGQYHACWCTGS